MTGRRDPTRGRKLDRSATPLGDGDETLRIGFGCAHDASTVSPEHDRIELVAAMAVADALADLVTIPEREQAWSNGTPISEIAGPREESLVELARLLVTRRGDPVPIEGVRNPDDPDRELNENRALQPGAEATIAGPTFEEWLESTSG